MFADRRDDFELFLAFYNKHENSQGLMAWQQVEYKKHLFYCEAAERDWSLLQVLKTVSTDSQVKLEGKILDDQEPQSNGGGSAPDGDLDAAYALLLSVLRWQHSAYTDRGIQVIHPVANK